MNTKLFNVLLFTTGAAVGSLVTWKVLKTRYERIAQEEIDSVKETWARLQGGVEPGATNDVQSTSDEDTDDEEYDPEAEEMIGYTRLASRYSGSSENDPDTSAEGGGDEEVPYINGPCLITPEDFGDGNYDHDCYMLTYYADGVLANDWWEEFNVDETIGEDSVNHFGEYVDNVLHVRNERLKADYEVVQDPRAYSEVILNDPLRHTHEN